MPSELRRRLTEQALGVGARIRNAEVVRVDGEQDAFTVQPRHGAPSTRGASSSPTACAITCPTSQTSTHSTVPPSSTAPTATDRPSPTPASASSAGTGTAPTSLSTCATGATASRCCPTISRSSSTTVSVTSSQSAGVAIRHGTVRRVVGHGGNLTQAEFDDGGTIRLDALFFHLGSEPRCELAQQLGCELDDDGYVVADRGRETSCPGVHAAGDIIGPPHLAAIAAADGIRAALAIHRSLLPDDRRL
jgi:hypothetical protein